MLKTKIDRFCKYFCATIVVVVCFVSISAQEGAASLRGTVLDQNGAVVPGATVSIANQETGTNRRTATTNEAGDYVFASLSPGVYRITVEAPSFKKAVK